ncbi:hypothetical protein VOLCADRAFT_56272 [Volvox carteri f. nagariensis]|uniref:5'-nucleotidase n=1 Tax=Volvox carteri f. nagariensis TaxID=3068 RepID=D8TKA6_VOLCA|nr:uncharacterized protein VOLCADRAFT_56272 [Volvox carteri f. nagariensis]EFJ52026.1 hypothetical protein VOLCADRAFT_56272 [Volvox carteri f. nagariensis]|eukprot:XP_002946800.1 hypothetical protein VOLCADRAFT_56272 [Volvox carteri f. nagariensis]
MKIQSHLELSSSLALNPYVESIVSNWVINAPGSPNHDVRTRTRQYTHAHTRAYKNRPNPCLVLSSQVLNPPVSHFLFSAPPPKTRSVLRSVSSTFGTLLPWQQLHSCVVRLSPQNPHTPPANTPSQGYGSHPPPRRGSVPLWTDDPIPPLPRLPVQRRIFCNRALNMKQIKAIGYDMDYTLAQYKPDTFEGLAHKETVSKLVEVFRYPEELRRLDFQWDYMTKGLIIDKSQPNLVSLPLPLNLQSFQVAYHGFQELPVDSVYNGHHSSGAAGAGVFDEAGGYGMVDTLFSLAEAYLYMQLVEMKDLYRDLRTAVDMCHRDGSLKRAVAANPEKFIHRDEHLVHVLETHRASGRAVFLATNSLFDYTNVVMNFLISGRTGACVCPQKTCEWLQYFDVVMVGCAKPSFFQHRAPLFSVDVNTGREGRGESPIRGSSSSGGGGGGGGNVFQGGWYLDLHKMLGVTEGSQVLYVGDHIYGDIVKSKKDIGWRTMLVVPELELELEKLGRSMKMQEELRQLRQLRDEYDDRIQRLKWSIRCSSSRQGAPGASRGGEDGSAEAQADRAQLKSRHSALLRAHHRQFHPIWGQLMKTGHQNSRFAHQIERYACLYTSHINNLAFISPEKSFMGRMDLMAHEWEDEEAVMGGLGVSGVGVGVGVGGSKSKGGQAREPGR